MSNSLAIKVENISKLYKLGQVGTGTLQQDIKRWWWKTSGKGDPFAKIGEVNDRTSKGNSDYVWALKDINFEVEKGKVLGIIGKNGAGKSTLLKILSKTTSPTSGSIKINGRIASLLEVGTGFHPELTGRENIYLNGAILGMTKREIRSKFDEIVDFSGVERYIDTPVKRYSSGMYVRLAFAVAAHLEPEILIVDEVLAVGDAEFQKKCLGKMKDVSVNDGRTVLFVSHNMAAVKQLCTQGIVMQNGTISYLGEALDSILFYQKDQSSADKYIFEENKKVIGNSKIKILKFKIIPRQGNILNISSGVKVKMSFYNNVPDVALDISFILVTRDEIEVLGTGYVLTPNKDSKKGVYSVEVDIPEDLLNKGNYYFKFIFGANSSDLLFYYDGFGFEILNEGLNNNFIASPGIIRPKINFISEYNG